MCQFKSAIILKDSVYVADHDHHTNMLNELKIKDTRKNAEILFVRAELIPKDRDIFSPVEQWAFRIDQDIIPDWFVEEYEKNRMIQAVKEWGKSHIHIGKEDFTVGEGIHYLKDCKRVSFDNSTVKAFDNSTVKAFGNSTVKAFGNSTVEAFDNSTVKAFGNSTVKAFGNSTVKAFGNSTVEASGNSTVKAFDNSIVKAFGNSTVKAFDNSTVVIPKYSSNKRENIVLSQNSTLKDCNSKTIYQSGDWKLVVVEDTATV